MNKIVLITTKGCAGCNIMHRLIREALKSTSKKIEFSIRDKDEVGKKWLAQNQITDFPTTIFIKDGIIKFKYVGTNPAIVILRWIDVYFK